MSIIPFPDRGPSASPQTRNEDEEASRRPTGESIAFRLSQSDTDALQELIDSYWTPLTLYGSRILDDMATAEDVVQDVFVSVWERRRDWEPRSVSAFLFRMTRNRCLDVKRSRVARRKREERRAREAPRRPQTPASALAEKNFVEAIDRSIQGLPERQREAFILAYLEDLSYSEVADIMDISVKTVGNHISAALGSLRKVLGPLRKDGEGPVS